MYSEGLRETTDLKLFVLGKDDKGPRKQHPPPPLQNVVVTGRWSVSEKRPSSDQAQLSVLGK